MLETHCIPLDFRYRCDPPSTQWWAMDDPALPVEDELPVLADPEWRFHRRHVRPVALALPGAVRHFQDRHSVVITIQVPCDDHGRIEADVRLLYQKKADEIFWRLYPHAELV